MWKTHGSSIPGSDEIWFAAIGPDTKALGEINSKEQIFQNQFAASLSGFLGLNIRSDSNPIGPRIKSLMDKND